MDRFPPAQDTPYLTGIAHLDRLWAEALFADEAPHMAAEALAGLEPEALARACLALHPSVRFAAFDAGVPGLWLAARDGVEDLVVGAPGDDSRTAKAPAEKSVEESGAVYTFSLTR